MGANSQTRRFRPEQLGAGTANWPRGREDRLDRPDVLNEDRWRALLAGASAEVSEDQAASEQLAYRLAGQYLPALLAARRAEDRQRVWSALWRYMTAAPTMSKPFVISDATADALIAAVQAELGRMGVEVA